MMKVDLLEKMFSVMLGVMFALSASVSAMTFSQKVEIGKIGFPVQAPYHGYVVKGATKIDGESYFENSPLISKPFYTYKNGLAQWGSGDDALFAKYGDVTRDWSNGWDKAIKLGGKNNYVISTEGWLKIIYRINTDIGLTIYSIVKLSGSEEINIIGRKNDGKWVSYIDSNILTAKYFNGKQAYKSNDGVHYSEPQITKDTIIISYSYILNHKEITRGEFRFKWDDAAQWFGIEQVVY